MTSSVINGCGSVVLCFPPPSVLLWCSASPTLRAPVVLCFPHPSVLLWCSASPHPPCSCGAAELFQGRSDVPVPAPLAEGAQPGGGEGVLDQGGTSQAIQLGSSSLVIMLLHLHRRASKALLFLSPGVALGRAAGCVPAAHRGRDLAPGWRAS